MSALQLNAVRFMCVYVMCECVSECALKLKRQTRDRNHFPKASIDDLLHIWAHFVHIYTQKITLKLSIFSALFRCISAIVSVCVTLILRLGTEHPIFLSFVIVTFYLLALSSNATNVARRATSGRSKKMINQCYSYHQRANKRLFDKWKIPFKWTETEERK